MKKEKYVFYETNKYCGFVEKDRYTEYMYQYGLKPIRDVIVSMTQQGLIKLLQIYEEDRDLYIDIIHEELNKNRFTSYYN